MNIHVSFPYHRTQQVPLALNNASITVSLTSQYVTLVIVNLSSPVEDAPQNSIDVILTYGPVNNTVFDSSLSTNLTLMTDCV